MGLLIQFCKSQCFAAKYLRKKHSNLINNVLHIFRVRLTKLDWLTQVILVELRSMNTPVLQAQGWREKGYSQVPPSYSDNEAELLELEHEKKKNQLCIFLGRPLERGAGASFLGRPRGRGAGGGC